MQQYRKKGNKRWLNCSKDSYNLFEELDLESFADEWDIEGIIEVRDTESPKNISVFEITLHEEYRCEYRGNK